MHRFYVTFPLSIDLVLRDKGIVSQIYRVLRMKMGDHIVLFDGDGSETEYEIIVCEKQAITLRGIAQYRPNTEHSQRIILYQALPNKYEKIEYIIQKGVEVGIQEFIFFRSDFSQKLVISPAKIERITTIAKEAVEQCGGVKMPSIQFLTTFPDVRLTDNRVLDTLQSISSNHIQTSSQDIGLWVGPEGGWSENERVKMGSYGFTFVRFGERVLRTETAGVVVAFRYLHD